MVKEQYQHRITPPFISKVDKDQVFVFGSNLAGRHGAGAALVALKFGARYGQSIGISGNTYAIPTKNERIQTLPLAVIHKHVQSFVEYAKHHPGETFLVTAIGCGLAGYQPKDIAPMFYPAVTMENVWLPEEFWCHL